MRRWESLPEAQKRLARIGLEEAVAALAMPIKRDKTTLKSLEVVSLDGRTQDFWVDFGDGKPARHVMLALVDSASNHVLGYKIARSENAVATARLRRNISCSATRDRDTWNSLEWLRAMAEDAEFSVAYCGDLALVDTASHLPQLWRRMRRRVVIKHLTKQDVATLAMHRGIADPSLVELLFRVARRGGGLGDVDNAIAHARLLSRQDVPGPAFIMTALEDLNLLSREDQP